MFVRRALLAALVAWATVGSSQQEPRLPQFTDRAKSAGVEFLNRSSATSEKYLIEAMVGGVAVFDYNGDGALDLFFVNGAALQDPMPPGAKPDKSDPRYWNRLYRNNGDGVFTDVTAEAGVQGRGYGQGVATGDYDNDGDVDLYVTAYGGSTLYRNNGDGVFTDVTAGAGVAGEGWPTSAAFLDYDRDGRLDLVVARYVEWSFEKNPWCGDRALGYRSYCHPDEFPPASHLLFHNEGDGRFRDVSQESGFAGAPGKGLGVAFNDFDRDGWPDIIVANDSAPQQMFRNNGDGTFEEVGLLLGIAYDEDGRDYGGMGVDFHDYDNDGWPDLFVNALALQRYHVYRNVEGLFEYASGETGISAITQLNSGWGTGFLDFDNDGWKDLFIAQGHVMDNIELTQPELSYREPLLMLRNSGGRFHNVSNRLGAPFRQPAASRGAAFGDLDNDGFVDFAVNCNNGQAKVIFNLGGGVHHWLTIETVGTRSNRDGIGAAIRLVDDSGAEQHGLVTTTGSYLSASDKRVHFGLGASRRVKLIEISWPSGIVQRLEDIAVDRILTVREPGN